MPTYQLVARQQWNGSQVRNVFYYTCSDVLGTTQLQDAADAMRTAFGLWVATGEIDNGWSFDQLEARRVDQADLPSALVTPTAGALAGDATPNPLPMQIALVVSLAAPTTKPRRARTYLAGVTVTGLAATGRFTTEMQDAAADFTEAMDTITVTGDTLLRVAALWSGSPPAVTATNRLQSYVVRAIPATQRRRREGSGS